MSVMWRPKGIGRVCSGGRHVITTPRLLLRSLTMADIPLTEALGSDPEAQRWLGWAPEDIMPEDERDHLLAAPVGAGRSRFGLPSRRVELGMLAIDPEYGLPAGAFFLTPESEARCELGGYLAPRYRGRGLGAELFAAGLALAQQHLHFTEVRAGVEPENVACARSLWRAGLDPADGPETHVLQDGRVIPSAWYSDVTPNPVWCPSGW
ncbi:GNAT family protein [Actinomadura sp. 7K534]|uniref:GNAT family N-acetyltransferase n=1 Tax=Actinomadura sp. 7K534 TaxID=2530366 RepID=UPI0014056002|nr:GNAT family protein [Actinomadura sp. 7K534]